MSTALAIASVTHVLKDLLNNGLIDHDITGTIGSSVAVTALPPDRVITDSTPEASQLNLFMYQATQNPGWRNQQLPAFNSNGERVNNPPLALDLHYLLIAYGAEELHHDILLGYGMQLLHETPVLTKSAIRRSLTPPASATNTSSGLPANITALSTSELADQGEGITITPETMNTEEMSRLWTAFGARYRPNAAYKVTVVLIESRKLTKPALPVLERNIYVLPFQRPVIDKISSQATPADPVIDNQKILEGYFLVITGTGLKAAIVIINIDGTEVTPATSDITDTQIRIPLPVGLQAGIHGVRVVHKLAMGSPPLPHEGFSSNVQAFVLSPNIIAIQVTDVVDDGASLRSANITVTVQPGMLSTQQMVLFLNELNSATPVAYSFGALPIAPFSPPVFTTDITFPVAGVKAGTYLVRIQVDGAESPLQADATTGFNNPQLTIP